MRVRLQDLGPALERIRPQLDRIRPQLDRLRMEMPELLERARIAPRARMVNVMV